MRHLANVCLVLAALACIGIETSCTRRVFASKTVFSFSNDSMDVKLETGADLTLHDRIALMTRRKGTNFWREQYEHLIEVPIFPYAVSAPTGDICVFYYNPIEKPWLVRLSRSTGGPTALGDCETVVREHLSKKADQIAARGLSFLPNHRSPR